MSIVRETISAAFEIDRRYEYELTLGGRSTPNYAYAQGYMHT
jgi:hypothetical protein